MNKSNWPRVLILVLVLSGFAAPAHASQADEQAVRQAVAGFYSALNILFAGQLGPMEKVWSHAEDITYMGPDGGYEIGWRQALAIWKRQAAMKLGGRVEPARIRVAAGPEIAVVSNYEKGINTNAAGHPQTLMLRATSIFRKEAGRWKMIGHHTDMLSYLKN